MRNPFKRSGSPYNKKNPQYTGSKPGLFSNKLKIVAGIITFVVIIIFMFESVVVVEAGHRGVVLYVGAVENRVLGEGIHFIIPFAEQVIQLEVRTLKFEANATAASNDLQEVQTTIALNYHISPSQANIIYQQLGADYADRIIAPFFLCILLAIYSTTELHFLLKYSGSRNNNSPNYFITLREY